MKGHVATALRWSDLPLALATYLGSGNACQHRFQAAFAASLAVQSDSVRLFGSGRAALHAFVSALGLQQGDEVLLPGFTCVVVPNVFMHLGISVRYVDIEPGHCNVSAQRWAEAIGPVTKLVLVPHNFGIVTAGLTALRAAFPAVIFVEDAAHAWGSADQDGMAAGRAGHAAFYSFEYSKCLSTGLGGALLINDPGMRQRFVAAQATSLATPSAATVLKQLLTLSYHRMCMSLPRLALRLVQAALRAPSRALGLVAQTPASELDGRSQPDYAQALHPLSAAVGLPQVDRATALWALRRRQALHYDELLAGSTRIHALPRAPGDVLLRYPVRVDPQHREALAQALLELGIEPGRWFDDVVHPKGSLRYGYSDGQCPVGESLAEAILNLPLGLHASLSAAQSAGLRAIALTP